MGNQMLKKSDFHFVNSTTPEKPRDLAVRSLIRKQAMKEAVATRKREGTYGRHKRYRPPVFGQSVTNDSEGTVIPFEDDSSSSTTATTPGDKRESVEQDCGKGRDLIAKSALTEPIPARLSLKGYALTSMKYGFDALNLSILTTVHVGRLLGRKLSADPGRLAPLLRHRHWSYFEYLPSRYGHSRCLTDATDCILARVRQLISPHDDWEYTVISSYVKAINSLQSALDCGEQRFQPEVLCAAEILGLYELLSTSREDAWVSHAAGAAQLVKLRGSESYNTDFEKALLLAHAGPIIIESLLTNTHCFLEEPPWTAVLKSCVIRDTFIDDRSEIVIDLLMKMSQVPGLFHNVTELICNNNNLDVAGPDHSSGIVHLTTQAYNLRESLHQWHRDFNHTLATGPPIQSGTHQYDKHLKLLGVFLSFTLITDRLIVALTGSPDLEDEAQSMATQILDLETRAKLVSPDAELFMAQKLAVARAIQATRQDWANMDLGTQGVMIERWRFERWCGLWGRKTYSGSSSSSRSNLLLSADLSTSHEPAASSSSDTADPRPSSRDSSIESRPPAPRLATCGNCGKTTICPKSHFYNNNKTKNTDLGA